MTKTKKIISYIVLIVASFLSAFPLYYMISGATNASIDIVRGRLIPGAHLIENFKTLIDMQNLGLAMFNSFRNAIVITLLTLLVCSIAGYGFEIYHDKGKDFLMSILLLAMMFPFVAIVVPLFKMFTSWKLVNTWIAHGAFLLAQKMELLEDPSMEGLEIRRQKHNEILKTMEQENKMFYGVRYFSAPAYLQYELTRLKLDFVQPTSKVQKTGLCPDFTEQEKKSFYEQNMDLFGRYHGDFFSYEEVEQIIEKRLREDTYDKLIENILREFENGE